MIRIFSFLVLYLVTFIIFKLCCLIHPLNLMMNSDEKNNLYFVSALQSYNKTNLVFLSVYKSQSSIFQQLMRVSNKIFLEVISTSPLDSKTIQDAGADRIQLVSALEIGGVTPSPVIIRKSLEAVSIPTHVIVRHHNNGFTHTKQETENLIDEVIELRDRYKVSGVVVGGLILQQNCTVFDNYLMSKVVKECDGKAKVTFHKASDYTTDLHNTVQNLSRLGINEILTQGGKGSALSNQNVEQINKIPEVLRKEKILAGGGINFQNVCSVIKQWKISRVHIGTCVRTNKYENVDGQLIQQFRNKIDNCI